MGKTSIEWTDQTWNPVVGCTKVSPGCAHCYAETMAARLKAMALADIAAAKDPGRKRHYIEAIDDKGRWSGKLVPAPEALSDPFGWKKPRQVFVNSMSDLFHAEVSFEFIDRVFAAMGLNSQHIYQVLTKRPERMAEYFQRPHLNDLIYDQMEQLAEVFEIGDWIFENLPWWHVWLGTSVENRSVLSRVEDLRNSNSRVRFLSIEPLLEGLGEIDLTGIDWVIVGGESGHNSRAIHPQWVRDIRDQCLTAEVPFFFKQWGDWIPDDARSTRFVRVGKKAAGRSLDGRTWDQSPSTFNREISK